MKAPVASTSSGVGSRNIPSIRLLSRTKSVRENSLIAAHLGSTAGGSGEGLPVGWPADDLPAKSRLCVNEVCSAIPISNELLPRICAEDQNIGPILRRRLDWLPPARRGASEQGG